MADKKIINRIRKSNLIENNEHIVVGLSGGPDSVCLFYVLHTLAEKMNLKLYPVHINHKFRPGAAEADQKYAEELSKSLGYQCQSFVYDCAKIAKDEKITSEEAGRKVRYKSFVQVADSIHAAGVPKEHIKIAVAQNADDQAETILFRLVRGAGTDGIAGMSYSRMESGYQVIRPMLDVFKTQVMDFCQVHELNPCIDATNLEELYTRNKIRLDLIPHIEEKFNPSFKDALIRLGNSARCDSDYIFQETLKLYKQALLDETDEKITFCGVTLAAAHRALRTRLYSIALSKLGLSQDVSFANLEAVDGLLANDNPSARADLPQGYYATKVYGDLRLSKPQPAEKKDFDFQVRVCDYEGCIESTKPKDSYAAFDFDAMAKDLGEGFEKWLVVDTRRPGDRIAISENSSKKIQDFFVDQKIPKDDRDKVLMLKFKSQVLWVLPGVTKGRFSGKYRVSKTTKKVIYIEF